MKDVMANWTMCINGNGPILLRTRTISVGLIKVLGTRNETNHPTTHCAEPSRRFAWRNDHELIIYGALFNWWELHSTTWAVFPLATSHGSTSGTSQRITSKLLLLVKTKAYLMMLWQNVERGTYSIIFVKFKSDSRIKGNMKKSDDRIFVNVRINNIGIQIFI